MRILAPLCKLEEVSLLSEAGADEFYCGLVNPQYQINDRPNNSKFNFSNVQDLSNAVKLSHKLNKKIFLVVNNAILPIKEAIEQAIIARKIDMDGVIIANLLLIKKLNELNLGFELCASCITPVLNSESVKLIKELGVKTVHMPRHIGLEELNSLCRDKNGVEISVFGMNGMCPNIESFCYLHSLKKKYFIPCKYLEVMEKKGECIKKEEINERMRCKPFSCGICAFKRLKEMGVSIIKIEGREHKLKQKIESIRITRDCLDMSEKIVKEKDYINQCKKKFYDYFNENCRMDYCYF